MHRFDDAIKYAAGISNNTMSKLIRILLKNNPMYNEEDVGKLADNLATLGPHAH